MCFEVSTRRACIVALVASERLFPGMNADMFFQVFISGERSCASLAGMYSLRFSTLFDFCGGRHCLYVLCSRPTDCSSSKQSEFSESESMVKANESENINIRAMFSHLVPGCIITTPEKEKS